MNGKTVTQFDYALQPGMKVAVSKTKRNQQVFKSRYLKIVYEDRWLIVVEKQPGILSMAAGHSSLNVKTVLDEYFKQSRQNCTAHVIIDAIPKAMIMCRFPFPCKKIKSMVWPNVKNNVTDHI